MPRTSNKNPAVRIAVTPGNAELTRQLEIERPGQVKPQVVLSLGPNEHEYSCIPDLAPGDRLLVSAEVEVTTDCTPEEKQIAQDASWPTPCRGEAYDYSPTVEGRLLLAENEATTTEGPSTRQLGKAKRQRLTHSQHHGVLVFAEARTQVPEGNPDWVRSPHLNLVLGAWADEAPGSDLLLVGENEPGGGVEGDKGRINVMRLRGQVPPPKQQGTRRLRKRAIPIDKEQPNVLLSLRLDNLVKDEQLVVNALVNASAANLDYEARFSTRLILADSPDHAKVDPQGVAHQVGSLGGEVGKHNGFNCLPQRGLTPSRRVGMFRIEENSDRPLYLNLVAESARPGHAADPARTLKIAGTGYLRALRYGPELAG